MRSPGLGLRCEENRGSLEDVALLFDALDPFAKLTKLISLPGRQSVLAFSVIELVTLDPVMQRLLAAPQGSSDVFHGPAAQHELHGFATKLRRIRRSASWHHGHPFASKPLKPLTGLQTGATPLPSSIAGVWKADLFLGKTDSDRWVATTVKSNPSGLESARGLRVGIVPATEAGTDSPFMDDKRRLAVCPLPYEGSFMETFYKGWEIVRFFLAEDAKLPREAALPRPPARHVARLLDERREFPVVEVVDHLKARA